MDKQQPVDNFIKYLIVEKNTSEHTINAYRLDIHDFFIFAHNKYPNVNFRHFVRFTVI